MSDVLSNFYNSGVQDFTNANLTNDFASDFQNLITGDKTALISLNDMLYGKNPKLWGTVLPKGGVQTITSTPTGSSQGTFSLPPKILSFIAIGGLVPVYRVGEFTEYVNITVTLVGPNSTYVFTPMYSKSKKFLA